MREDYFGPVGFAREPAEERRRWIGRILTLALVIFIVLLAWFRVFRVPVENPTVPAPTTQSELPGPK